MKFLYVRMNAKTPQRIYDNYVRSKPSNEYTFVIDFVYDEKAIKEEEVTPFKLDQIRNSKYYGTKD